MSSHPSGQRYGRSKANAFAHEVELPESLITARDLYPAYLLQNSVPGDLRSRPKSVPVLLSTEGVVSSLFYRWVTNDPIQRRYRDAEFYTRFGTTGAEVTPLENCYLKLYHVLFTCKPTDTAELIAGYKTVFPEESALIDAVVQEILFKHPIQGGKTPRAAVFSSYSLL